MDFTLIQLLDGTPAIRADGPIEAGDAAKLEPLLEQIPPGIFEERRLILNSPGGDIAAALEIAALIDQYRVMTIIAWQDICISACATILYFSGDARMILGDGRLIFHNCQSTSPAPRAQTLCNLEVAEFVRVQGYPPDWIIAGISSHDSANGATDTRGVGIDTADCFYLQQPPWLEHWPTSNTPCKQLLQNGRVDQARDWDTPPSEGVLFENMRSDTPTIPYVYSWLPPDQWSFGFEQDGVSIAFRRYGHHPSGPELAVQCHHRLPDSLILWVRTYLDSQTLASVSPTVTAGALSQRLRWLHTQALPNGTSVGIVELPARLASQLRNQKTATFTAQLTTADGKALEVIEAPWHSGWRRYERLFDFCAGTFHDSR